MHNSGIWAVVPVKRFKEAKTRLDSILTNDERECLSRAMLTDVLTTLSQTPSIAGVLVVTRDPEAKMMAESTGARVLEESAEWGHNVSVMKAARLLQETGCNGLFCIPGDVPLVTVDDIEHAVNTHGDGDAVTLIPSLDGKGSNGIVCSPPDVIPFCYGENSFLVHLATAQVHGIGPKVLKLSGLGLDIDSADDLTAFIQKDSDTLTAQYLADSGVAKRLLNNTPDCNNLGVG